MNHATSPINHATECPCNVLHDAISILATGNLGVDSEALLFATEAIIDERITVATNLIQLADVNHRLLNKLTQTVTSVRQQVEENPRRVGG